MSAAEVAAAYGLPAVEVARWAPRTVEIFARVAVRRGWLVPDLPEEN